MDHLFYQQVTQGIFESLLTQKFKTEHNGISDESVQDKLTTEEENAVNYVVRSVKEKAKE